MKRSSHKWKGYSGKYSVNTIIIMILRTFVRGMSRLASLVKPVPGNPPTPSSAAIFALLRTGTRLVESYCEDQSTSKVSPIVYDCMEYFRSAIVKWGLHSNEESSPPISSLS